MIETIYNNVHGEIMDVQYFDTRKMVDACNDVIARQVTRAPPYTLTDTIQGTTDFSDSVSAYLAAGRKVKHFKMMIVPNSDETIESL